MPDVRNKRASGQSAIHAHIATRESVHGQSPRLARRKHETRVRLLDAAFRLLTEKGMESVTIGEITHAADVGFGSFYNYFESKEGILAALVDWLFEDFANRLDGLTTGLADPAEVIAVSVRHTLLRACREPVWGQLLIREGLSTRALSTGLGQRLLRDAAIGISKKRFMIADELMCVVSAIGTVLAGVAAELDMSASSKRTIRARKVLRSKVDRFGERTASIVLQGFGLNRLEAEKIARRPLPAAQESEVE
ncbi:TetR/AcrR family transcriptional regulator [Paraburkholderia atlantica]|uniref:TetR/AcrR family transcriptional regulator n=1 Tax=Paraburkholderia atlantica TaxID=2654982 RepID=UPI001612D14A|nr:TetR/AcrR family transcriptional regulator [Paraburkholderia atlantica]